ncbi:MAG: dTDP-4-dehydrorhamnose 3,5-epimerase [Candidatus Moranbacteria bacterium]|nr:dTDP-4-dehydrorhamnose 3,5-epimerase [Candidatus Moranbacteria bacterium]
MKYKKTQIEGLLIIEPDIFADDRGHFSETFSTQKYKDIGIDETFTQDNMSLSHKNVLRGLHYQKPPYAQGKLVSVLSGSVLDVAVDMRQESPTKGQYVAVELSSKNHKQFWIPSGFAHGFLSLEDDTIFTYKCTNYYNKESESGIRWDDPVITIDWPTKTPIVSHKDQELPLWNEVMKESSKY